MPDPATSAELARCLAEQEEAAAFLHRQARPTDYHRLWICDWIMEETIVRLATRKEAAK